MTMPTTDQTNSRALRKRFISASFVGAILLLVLAPVMVNGATAAVQPPPPGCNTNCAWGTDNNGKWVKVPITGGTGPAGPAGANGGPYRVVTYAAGMTIAPDTWYLVPGTANVAIPLPTAGTAPFGNPTNICFTNIGSGQVTFSATPAIVNGPSFLGTGQTYCFGVTDQTPATWVGDGGN